MLVAATSGFRGGRIFPTLFVGVALGFAIHAVWDAVPLALAIGAAVVGIIVAATRNGWLSLFMAVAVVPQVSLLIGLLLAALAAWLLVTNRPPLLDPVEDASRRRLRVRRSARSRSRRARGRAARGRPVLRARLPDDAGQHQREAQREQPPDVGEHQAEHAELLGARDQDDRQVELTGQAEQAEQQRRSRRR